MELLTADRRPHHFVELRDTTFRPARSCQARRLTRSGRQVAQSCAALYRRLQGLSHRLPLRGETRRARLDCCRVVR
jgi:hypothetical protein